MLDRFSTNQTNEFSFILKPSTIPNAGIGVFATHPIQKGTKLILAPKNSRSRQVKGDQLPELFKVYCCARENDMYAAPLRFNRMEIGWFINHSFEPNIEKRSDGFFALQDIAAGDEIVMDYNTLNEPENKKEAYYKKT